MRKLTVQPTSWPAGLGIALGLLVVGCAPHESAPPEDIGQAQSAVFANGGFEIGLPNVAPPSWTVQTFINPTAGVTIQSPQTRAGLNLQAGGKALTTEQAGVNVPDPDLGAAASLRYSRYGNQVARVNFHSSNNFGGGPNGNAQNVNSLSQTMTIGAGDIDPADGKVHIRFTVAPVMQNPGHPVEEQPYYFVLATNVTQNTILYSDFNLSAQPGVPWKTVNGGTANEIDYVDWSLVDISPSSAQLAMGDQVKLEIIAAGCSLGAHFGEIYVDGAGTTIPGLFVSGTAPAQANADTDITYAMSYTNGSAAQETGVIIDFTTPPGTTFQGIVPPAGATCVTPAVGATGTIKCTFSGPVPAGATGTFDITVHIDPAATGVVTCGTYDIHSNQETPLLGSKITTEIGCNADSDCSGGNWCNFTANACTPKLPNNTLIPNDPPHTNPAVTGVCTPAVGALVCASGVCDSDDACGYHDGNGPCDAATGPVVCRSTVCSTNGTCEPLGGCNVDADCTGGSWCAESTHTCTAKLPNGTAIPNDPPHTNPALGGTCTAPAATLVCVSGVCDTSDNACGYDLGDGPCTQADAGVVCRSGACSTNGAVCVPMNGCAVDADCAGTDYCDATTFLCVPKAPNGDPVPTSPGHTPVLDGTCTAPAGTASCASGVCDAADNDCGYADGDGPCDAANGGVVCRSGACAASGVCEAAGGCSLDLDCQMTQYCNTPSHTCAAKLPNGQAVPTVAGHTPTIDGTCTAASGLVVCQSGVCDPADDACGLADGDGPCTVATEEVCRSGMCSASGVCEPATGCVVDGDCTAPDRCNPATHTCVGCLSDMDCGGATSGKVCDDATNVCEDGCRGTDGNGCPDGLDCSSTDATIGMCNAATTSSSGTTTSSMSSTGAGTGGAGGAGGATSSSGTDTGTSTSTATAAGGGGSDASGVIALGGGCSTSPEGSNDGAPTIAVAIALAALASKRRRRA